ncbi:hypothetical protein ADK76_29070 [Streptomyces griseoflavus]|uniref:hypothetical protein n=1 Tax=Streptomyces rimosus TaxID=1927 RepID=UPI00067B7EB4|nr:hypothetical protein [Streptomyces rimosus]KOG53162.1 hypothetical protein ADK76_29070 [Streptomyces griseoflavus]
MNVKEAVAREVILRALLDVIGPAYQQARAEAQHLLDAAEKDHGTRQVAAALPDGRQIAVVSLTGGTAEAKVTDERAFTRWVAEGFPTEIERRFVTTVRPAFAERILNDLTATGRTSWADPQTGVLHEVPGIRIAPSRARTHSVRFAKTGRADIARAWRDGHLAALALPRPTPDPGEAS